MRAQETRDVAACAATSGDDADGIVSSTTGTGRAANDHGVGENPIDTMLDDEGEGEWETVAKKKTGATSKTGADQNGSSDDGKKRRNSTNGAGIRPT